MSMNIASIVLAVAALSTGLMAGLFFTWTNAVTPGLRKLGDRAYLQALQSMNRAILNPTFKLVFLAAPVSSAMLPVFYFWAFPDTLFWVLMAAFLVYGIGTFGVTLFGNIPLNDRVDNTNLETISREEAARLRASIEIKWNNLNLVRTITSIISFFLLIVSMLF